MIVDLKSMEDEEHFVVGLEKEKEVKSKKNVKKKGEKQGPRVHARRQQMDRTI